MLMVRPGIEGTGRLRDDAISALQTYFSLNNPSPPNRLQLMTVPELDAEFEWAKAELDRQFMFALLAEMEALFRDDFKKRRKSKSSDTLTIACRTIAKSRGSRVRFDEDILDAWKLAMPGASPIIGQVRSAFRLRHWFAHGRHFVPKLGKTFDFAQIEFLAQSVSGLF